MESATHTDPFRALADPTRREILELLRLGPLPVRELAERFPQMSRPAVSKHLRILRQARLATENRDGRHRIYRLEAGALEAVAKWFSAMEGALPAELPVPPIEPLEAAAGPKKAGGGGRARDARRRTGKPDRPVPRGSVPVRKTEPTGNPDGRRVRGPAGGSVESLHENPPESPSEEEAGDWRAW